MTTENLMRIQAGTSEQPRGAKTAAGIDPRQKALALGLEFAKRCLEAASLDDLYLLLTNDIRALMEFDRSILIVHLGGFSSFVSAGNQPAPEKKSKFHDLVTELAEPLKDLDKGVLLSGKAGTASLSGDDLSDIAKEALQSYMNFSGCMYLFCVPLKRNDMIVGHLIFEFLESDVPAEISILTILNVAPFMAAALAEKWLLLKKPGLISLLDPRSSPTGRLQWARKHSKALGAAIFVLIAILFFIPVPFTVGGEAEVVPRDKHVAFCKIDGLIERIYVAEASKVEKGQALATLDPKELDYKLKIAEKQFEILTSEMVLLRSAANEDPSKLAESNLVELKRKSAWEEIQYIKWQQQFLTIKSPVVGTILTKDIESLAGKKLKAGEPLCEIVAPGELCVDVHVPEDKIAYVKRGQETTVYLAGNPRKGYELIVDEIAPITDVMPRLGNIYRVRAPFPDAPPNTMVGMTGIGKIHTMDSTLWFIVSERVLSRWQRWSLHF